MDGWQKGGKRQDGVAKQPQIRNGRMERNPALLTAVVRKNMEGDGRMKPLGSTWEAVNATQSSSGDEGWPLKETQDHNLFKIYMVRIFWVGTEAKICQAQTGSCWNGLKKIVLNSAEGDRAEATTCPLLSTNALWNISVCMCVCWRENVYVCV